MSTTTMALWVLFFAVIAASRWVDVRASKPTLAWVIASTVLVFGLFAAALVSDCADRRHGAGEVCAKMTIDRGEIECTLWDKP